MTFPRKQSAEAPPLSEEQFRQLSAVTPEALFFTEDGFVLGVNEAGVRMFGYADPSEMIGRRVLDFAAPESRPLVRERIGSGFSDKYEHVALHRDGTRFPVEAHGGTVLHQGRSARVTTLRDITQRKRAEEALRQTDQRHRAIVEALPDLVFRLRRDGEIIDFKAPVGTELNLPLDQVRGGVLGVVLPPAIAEQILRHAELALAVDGLEIFEYSLATPGGEEHYEARLVPSGFGEVLALIRNITERLRAEEVLEESEAKFRSLTENSHDVITIVGADGTIRYESPSVRTVLGYRADDLLGTHLLEQVHPDDRVGIAALFEDLLSRPGEKVSYELRYRHGKGHWVVLDGIASNMLNDPAVQGIVANSRDITDRVEVRKKLETYSRELERSNRELQDFAYVASHDLQEPLRKIQAFGDRLKSRHADALGTQGADYLDRMQNAAVRMQALIRDLLVYARVTSKAQPFMPVDLTSIATEVAQDLQALTDRTGGRIDIGRLPQAEADPLQIRQLLQNLIGNGLKFYREGVPPVVEVSAEVQAGMVKLRVSDNGIGFEEKYLDRIFTPFERLHGRSGYEGTGMGLAICRKIAERHGGDISARSSPGHGATFSVTLPVSHGVEEGVF